MRLGPARRGPPASSGSTRDGTVRDVTISKTDYSLDPVSDRYGAKIINDGGKKVGYINLRTFIDTAEQDLRTAFAIFKAQGMTEVIVDLRYNGGGLVSISELFGDLLARRQGRAGVQLHHLPRQQVEQQFGQELRCRNRRRSRATKIAFIGTSGTASASELLANAFIPYLGSNTALIGTNTYGKPVGQIAIDKAECDDRMRVIAFRTENANHQGDYFGGLAQRVPQDLRRDRRHHPPARRPERGGHQGCARFPGRAHLHADHFGRRPGPPVDQAPARTDAAAGADCRPARDAGPVLGSDRIARE